MAEDRVRYRVEVDADEAQRELKETARGMDDLGAATKRASREGEDATRSLDDQTQATGDLRDSVGGMVAGWASFAAIAGTVKRLLNEIGQAAQDAAEQVSKLGANTSGLAANIGGERSDVTIDAINRIAAQQRLDPEGRDQLIAGAVALTDLRDLDQPQLEAQLQQLALIRRATGQGGAEIAGLTTTLQTRLGLSDEQAANQATLLLNSGFDAATIREVAERGGGQEGLALLLGTRAFGDPNRRGEALNQVLAAVNRRDAQGNLAPELQALGLTAEQSEFERLQALAAGAGRGAFTDAQLQAGLGGFEQAQRFGPFAQAINQGQLDAARRSLQTFTTQQAIEAQRQSEFVRFHEAERARELRRQLAKETEDAADLGSVMGEVSTYFAERGYGREFIGFMREAAESFFGGPAGFGRRLGEHLENMEGQGFIEFDGGAGGPPARGRPDVPLRSLRGIGGALPNPVEDQLHRSVRPGITYHIGSVFNTGGNPFTDPDTRANE